ncbi:nucleotidyltransferase family protein [Sphaerotilus mobilis]|uniref:Molybdenum cofactor cytidylyltransferase n=1 Tax=Sphaerotilus mobilis TaxID=47994 RepID=A0A4Q7LXI0_9BURK|nr:nucleotidyltransferase family protein [Sphaerotilus mobilis]RZS58709.1 molybdenum cofactor cytidylyltransferase [Sphaerotilus mobilis]
MTTDRNLPTVVVVAAGRGQRFDGEGHKLAQPFGASTVLESTLECVVASGLPMVLVTTAPLVAQAQQVIAARDIVLLPPVGSYTGEPLGMGYTIASGVAARAQSRGWLVLPGDMPLLRPATLRKVAQAMSQYAIVYPQHRGRRGHPVGFSPELYTELISLTGDEGARRLVARYPAHGIDVDDPGVLVDIDTRSDLEAARALQGEPAADV